MVIKVYVSCCGVNRAVAAVEGALTQSGVEARVEVVRDIRDIRKEGVMYTPSIKIDDRLVACGRVPNVPELSKRFAEAFAQKYISRCTLEDKS